MSLTNRIALDLPFLRRYSRAISGSQMSGDAYVVAALETLIADVSTFPEATSDRVALYKLFTQILKSASIEYQPVESPYPWERQAGATLSTLPSMARQAFVLASVEGFTPLEIAEILSTSHGQATSLLDIAAHDISKQIKSNIMIIEDEPLIALDIEQILQDLGHRVTGIARTKEEAVRLYRTTRPQMILSDIHLADGSSGIDAVNDILTMVDIPVIFITAFPERLLTGDRPEPTFLVTKPYHPEMLKALVSQALFFNEQKSQEIAESA
jgi:CheY-like chemotaxis protein